MINNDLKKFIKGDVIDRKDAAKYRHDASLFEIIPEVVVAPKDIEDIQNLVTFASKNKKVSLTARSGGTDMTGGPLSESIVLDFTKYFHRIKNISNFSAVVEPGVYYRDFEKEALKQGLLLPSYPASKDICTLGGMVANNSGGEKTLAYGKTEDYVTGLKVILSDGKEYLIQPLSKKELMKKIKEKTFEGELYKKMHDLILKNEALLRDAKPKVSKNSAGYYLWNVWNGETFDLTKLFVGSQGTLGIITEVKMRLVQPKSRSRLTVIFLKDVKQLTEIVKTVMRYRPESFESFDDHTFRLALQFLPSLIRVLRPKNIFKLGISFLPELKMILTGGLPKLVLLAEFSGDNDEEINVRLKGMARDLALKNANFRILKNEEEAKKYWTIRRESFNLLRQHIKGRRTAPFIDDFIVQVEKLPQFLPRLNAILEKYDLIYTIAGHVGDGNFHIIPLMDLSDPKSHEVIKRLSDEVYDLVLEFRGSITAEHNDGLIRTPYLEKMYGPKVYKLFIETKKIFDPKNIFNPGKKVGGDLEYAFAHLVKD
jgi:FAD/FMN-containing dehydrogenase